MIHKNGEGYPDPTAAGAIKEADRQPENVENAIRRMKTVARWHNLEVIGRIWLRDPETGQVLIDILFDDPLVKLNSAIIDYNHCQWQGLRRHKCPIDNDFVYEAKQSSRA